MLIVLKRILTLKHVLLLYISIQLGNSCFSLRTIDSFLRILKTGLNLIIFYLIFVENYLKYDAIHNISVQLRTSSNPADIYRFQSHTENKYTFVTIQGVTQKRRHFLLAQLLLLLVPPSKCQYGLPPISLASTCCCCRWLGNAANERVRTVCRLP